MKNLDQGTLQEVLKEILSPEQWEIFSKKSEDEQEEELSVHPYMGDCARTVRLKNGTVIVEKIGTANANIKELRLENGLTQAEVAKVLNISQREYWRYEQDGYSVNILTLAKLAVFYNISLDWISGAYPIRKSFIEGVETTNVNGYYLSEMKEAKARGEKYIPRDMSE